MKILYGALALYVGFLVVAHVLVTRSHEPYDPRMVIVLAALPFIPLAIAARSGRDLVDALRIVLASGTSALPGKPAALPGSIRLTGAPVVSPLFSRPCAAWALYEMTSKYVQRTDGRRLAITWDLVRRAETPFVLRTDGGDVALESDGARTLLETVEDPDSSVKERQGPALKEVVLVPDSPCVVFGDWRDGLAGVRVRRIVLGGTARVAGRLLAEAFAFVALGVVVGAGLFVLLRSFLPTR